MKLLTKLIYYFQSAGAAGNQPLWMNLISKIVLIEASHLVQNIIEPSKIDLIPNFHLDAQPPQRWLVVSSGTPFSNTIVNLSPKLIISFSQNAVDSLRQRKFTNLQYFCYRIGYSVPMFTGFILMFLSTISKYIF